MHFLVENGELFQEHTPEIQRPDVAFTIAASVLLDRLDLALIAYRFPDQWFNPIETVEHDRVKLVFLVLQCTNLGEQFADRLSLREPGDIELLGAFLGTDKDGARCMACPTRFADSIRAVDERKDVPWAFAVGDGGKKTDHTGVHRLDCTSL